MFIKSPLTGAASRHLFTGKVLNKYEAHYFYDEEAKFIFVNNPTWLEEAYSSAISSSDTGILERNIRNIDFVEKIVAQNYVQGFDAVDLGGGHGLFVRGMRDRGFDFRWSDKFAENIFARGFEATDKKYTCATAFEVLEHTLNPLGFLKKNLSNFHFDFLIFSAQTFDPLRIPDRSWWYWAFESGQHVSFFSSFTLRWMAESLGFCCRQLHGDIYVFYRKEFPFRWRKRNIFSSTLKFPSLSQSDHRTIVEKLHNN